MLHGCIRAALRADAYKSDTWICSSPRQARGRAHSALQFTMLCIRTAAFWVDNLSLYVSTQERHFKLTLINFLPCQQWPRSLCTSDAHKFLSMSSLNAFLCGWKDTILYLPLITVFLYFCSKILVSVVCALLSTQQALLHSSPYLFCFAVRLLHMWDFSSVNLLCCYAYKLLASVNLLRPPSFSCRLPQSAFVN